MGNICSILGMGVIFLTGFQGAAFAESNIPLTVNIHRTDQFKAKDKGILTEAKNLIEAAINSEAFRNRVLNFTYQGKKEFVQNNGMTNQQIYDYLMSGAEKLPAPSAPNHVMDLSLALYAPGIFDDKTVIGYTSEDDPIIHINRRIYRDSDPSDIADNLVHEWCHKMGFDHDFEVTERRNYSVPYGIGYIIDDLVQKLQ